MEDWNLLSEILSQEQLVRLVVAIMFTKMSFSLFMQWWNFRHEHRLDTDRFELERSLDAHHEETLIAIANTNTQLAVEITKLVGIEIEARDALTGLMKVQQETRDITQKHFEVMEYLPQKLQVLLLRMSDINQNVTDGRAQLGALTTQVNSLQQSLNELTMLPAERVINADVKQ